MEPPIHGMVDYFVEIEGRSSKDAIQQVKELEEEARKELEEAREVARGRKVGFRQG